MCDCISACGIFKTQRLLLSSVLQDKEVMCPKQKNKYGQSMRFLFNYFFSFLFFFHFISIKKIIFYSDLKRFLPGFAYSAPIDKHFTVNHNKSMSLRGVF